MPVVLVIGPTVMQNSVFLHQWWPKPSPVLIVKWSKANKCLPMDEWPPWVGLGISMGIQELDLPQCTQ